MRQSLFGDSALWLAMGIWIKVLTGSSAAAGLSFFALAFGSLCGPLGGLLADKVRRRPLLIVTNLATAGLVLLLLPGCRTDAAFTLAYALPQTMAIALGAGLIGVLSYRILLLAIAGLMALAAGYLCTRREQRRVAAARPRPVMS